jgi:hypothetical protein
MTENKTRDDLIDSVHMRAGDNTIDGLFPFAYSTDTGARFNGEATSALGAMFAPMALYLPVQLESRSGRNNTDEGSGTSNAGAIAGGVIGSVAILLLIFLVVFFWRRHQQKKKKEEEDKTRPNSFPTHDYSENNLSPRSKLGPSNNASTPPLIQISGTQRFNGKRTHNSAPEQPQPTSSLPEPRSASEAINSANFDIRNEFEQIRRDIQEIRATGVDGSYEPPPQYQMQ